MPSASSASSSSHGAASQPASRSSSIALSCWPLSITQNLVIVEAASLTATNRSAKTSSITASLASTVRTWWARKSCSYAVLIGTSTSPATAVPIQVRTNRDEFCATSTTRSPTLAPWVRKLRPTRSAEASISAYVQVASSSGASSHTESGRSAAW